MTYPPQQPNTDELYDSYDKNLYLLANAPGEDSILQMMQSDPGANNANDVEISGSDIGSGVSTADIQQAAGAQTAGKKTFADTADGYFLGIVDGVGVFNLGGASSYVRWDGTTLTVVGGVNVSSLNIPDTTTASSFHVDTSGNTWWGANVATGYAGANAYVLATGTAVFKNISVGGSTNQFQINNNGIYSFGDGSDGAGVADGVTALAGAGLVGSTYTLTRDVYYTDLTISTGVVINPGGYRIFGTGTLTMNGTAKISRDGNSGGTGTAGGAGGGGGTGGAALADGYLKGSPAGPAGGTGSVGAGSKGGNGTNGTSVSNSIGSGNGATGGQGGSLGAGPSSGGVGGTTTTSNVKLIANWHLATLLDISSTGSTVKFTTSAGSGSGGGGESASGALHGAGGGGAGSGGGIVAIYFRNIVIGASASVTANGGNGGNGGGGSGGTNNFAGGGGGAGANGGIIVIVYNVLSNSGSLTATAGTGGNTGGGDGAFQTAGSNGTGGTIYQFQISL